MAVEEKQIKTLIIQYDDAIRCRKKLLDCNLAETLLSTIPICIKNRDVFEAKLKETSNECELLKTHLEIAQEKVAKLYEKYEKDTQVKKFLDFAVFLSSFRDSSEETDARWNDFSEGFTSVEAEGNYEKELNNTDDEHESNGSNLAHLDVITDECKRLNTIPIVANDEDISSLNSILKKAYELLDTEILRRKQTEKERDNLSFLSERLCSLLLDYEKLLDTRERNSQTSRDHLDIIKIKENYSSTKEKYQVSVSPSSNFHNDTPVENVDSDEAIFSNRNENSSHVSDKTSTRSTLKTIESDSVDNLSPHPSSTVLAQSHPQNDVSVTEINHNFHDTQDMSNLNVTTQTSHKSLPVKRQRKSSSSRNFDVQCDICGVRIAKKCHLIRHIQQVHDKKKPFKCSSCKKRFARKEHLKSHAVLVHRKLIFNCPICNKHFYDASENIEHQRVAHEANASLHSTYSEQLALALFKCSMCSSCFSTRYKRKRHEWQIHQKGVFFRCPHCANIYSNEANLSHHQQISHAHCTMTRRLDLY